ncbi:MAG: 50S ribosomal protein L25 [Planctomycetes bacterium]|nr:50S ribosomal protein L25 [Planctomycetota bacterium]
MSDVLEVAAREQHGKLRNRRLRASGHLPAVLYGHGEESVSLSISSDQLRASLRHGAKVVQLAGAAKCQALLKDIQWDTFQQYVLHVDLLRVDEKDRVKIEVPVSLRGEAPGTHEGGVIEHLIHHLEIETSPANIPEQLQANVNELHLGGLLKASELSGLPEGATFTGDADAVIVQCVEPTATPSEEDSAEEAVSGSVEPEVIGQKKDDDEQAEAK